MFSLVELRSIAKNKIKDADILFYNKRYDGSVYLCGYAIEIALKKSVWQETRKKGFPENRTEFSNLNKLKTHDLSFLLDQSGKKSLIIGNPINLSDWSIIIQWNPESRYSRTGTKTRMDAINMLDSTKRIISLIL